MTVNKKKLPRAIRPAGADAPPAEAMADIATVAKNVSAFDAVATNPEVRRAVAVKLVERLSLWSGAAGLIPVPLVDLAAVGGVQIRMLGGISKIYDIPFSENIGKSLIASLVGSMVPMTSAMGAASIIKSVPLLGTVVSAFAMPAMSAGATYAIGMVFIQHFASGGTLLDFNPRDYREIVKAQKEKWSGRSGA